MYKTGFSCTTQNMKQLESVGMWKGLDVQITEQCGRQWDLGQSNINFKF